MALSVSSADRRNSAFLISVFPVHSSSFTTKSSLYETNYLRHTEQKIIWLWLDEFWALRRSWGTTEILLNYWTCTFCTASCRPHLTTLSVSLSLTPHPLPHTHTHTQSLWKGTRTHLWCSFINIFSKMLLQTFTHSLLSCELLHELQDIHHRSTCMMSKQPPISPLSSEGWRHWKTCHAWSAHSELRSYVKVEVAALGSLGEVMLNVLRCQLTY